MPLAASSTLTFWGRLTQNSKGTVPWVLRVLQLMAHGGVELGTDRTELLHWVTLFQEATVRLYVADPHNSISGSCISISPIYIFASFCSLFPVICWAVNQNLTFNRRIQPSTLPFANVMALGSAAISSLISVAFKWYEWKKINDMHVKGLNGHQMLVLSPSFPSFISSLFLEEEKLQFRGNTLTKLPKTMHLPFKVDRKAKLQSLKRKVTLRVDTFYCPFIDQGSRKRSDELGARKEGTGFIPAVLSLATRGLQSRVRWNWWCPLGHWSGCRRQSYLRSSKSEGRKKKIKLLLLSFSFLLLENHQRLQAHLSAPDEPHLSSHYLLSWVTGKIS